MTVSTNFAGRGWLASTGLCEGPQNRADLEEQFAVLGVAGGPMALLGAPWSWAFALRSLEGELGFLAVSADVETPAEP